MTLAGVITRVGSLPDISEWLSRLPEGGTDLAVTAGVEPFVLAAALQQGVTGSVIAITATGRQAEELSNAIADLGFGTAVFPSWETLPHERLSPTADTVGRRMAVISDVAAGTLPQVLVVPVRALMQPFAAELADERPIVVSAGDDPGFDDLVAALARAGYERVPMVERRGQFAVRGGIIDVFAPTEEHPSRIEFFGDEVDELRVFAVSDQRTLAVREKPLRIPVCRELMLTDEVRVRAKALVDRYPHIADVLGDIAAGTPVEGMESLAPVLADRMITLLDLLPAGTPVVNVGPERIEARAVDLVRTSEEFLQAGWHNAAVGNSVPLDLSQAAYRSTEQLRDQARQRQLPVSAMGTLGAVAAGLKPAPAYRGDVSALAADCRAAVAAGIPVVIAMGAAGPAQRLAEQLAAQDVAVRLLTDSALRPDRAHRQGTPDQRFQHRAGRAGDRTRHHRHLQHCGDQTARETPQGAGSTDPETRGLRRAQPAWRGAVPGDDATHRGRFRARVPGAGVRGEQTWAARRPPLRAHRSARPGHPLRRWEKRPRCTGSEAPTGRRPSRRRRRRCARSPPNSSSSTRRGRPPGATSSAPTPRGSGSWRTPSPTRRLPDQMVTIDEVKADMRKPVPMDRLICGDVGFGKTEIAVRAAFKAVQEGKQVAVLVPTTLLVKQHFNTFSERFASFPVRVEALSRFQSDAEADRILQGLADGKVDVVIATHRLLSPRTRIPELGLLIVDEEQRFGVEHKEHIKALRTSVDVLSMSATPIPRTLEMAVTGIREISTIATPPEDRLPVLTFVGPYDNKQIAAAIHRELMREGQVFFIHNRVESIARATAKLAELVPEARIAYAHGQMPEAALEQTVVDFWEGRVDVLVCTTIVESGMDIPNANTLIVERADAFGLSQLHQLRGRVGRGRERAYAYFLYPPEKPLTQTAHDRLETIAAHTDLGSGMAVAMKDLEIRGAGNLLGGEQSGHIANIGFDLYVRMVGEALAAVRGEQEEEIPEVRIELPLNAHLPHDYVPDERLRLMAYTTLAQAHSESQVTEFVEEMTDRYGPLPQAVTVLVEVARLRLLARAAGITDIVMAGTRVRMAPVHLPESRTMRLSRLYPGSLYKAASGTVLVPRPTEGGFGAKPLADHALIQWARSLIESVLDTSRE